MASRLPNEENDESMRPILGWDQAMAALQRNILQQNQQHQTSLNQAAAAAIAAGLTPPTSLANAAISPLWPYNLPGATGMLQPAAAAAAAASLASLSNPANSYLNHLQNLHNPESLLSFQQNLLLIEQLQQQRQLLAANPHLLMALQAAQTNNASISPQSHNANHHPHHHQHHHHQAQHHNLLNHANLQIPISDLQQHHASNSPKMNGTTSNNNGHGVNSSGISSSSSSSSSAGIGGAGGVAGSFTNGNTSLLTTVNSNLASALTNQHQDSLVDQHFRRSLGDDYNQIMSNKIDKINVGK